jgi:hypothetical protein
MQNAICPASLVDRLKRLGSPSFTFEVVLSCIFFVVASGYLDLNFLAGLVLSGVLACLVISVGIWRALTLDSRKSE